MAEATPTTFRLTPQQVNYFRTFGYVKLPGLFADDIGELTEAFDEIFASTMSVETHEWLHFDDERQIIPKFIERHPTLARLPEDPRVVEIVRTLVGEDHEYAESDGNLFSCDSSWHPDTYGAPLTRLYVKLSFYLDPLRADSGAIRMIPGSNHYLTNFAGSLYRNLQRPEEIEDRYGVPWDQIPCTVIETDPGDLVVWMFRTVHASFGGNARRRLFSVSFVEPEQPTATG